MITEVKTENPMRIIKIDKITLNIGAGAEVESVDKAVTLLGKITSAKVVKTLSKKRIATWKIRQGLPIGAKVTIRGKKTIELLKRLLKAVNNELPRSCFTQNGFSFGIKEYIDIPDTKYDAKIGIIGLEVSVSLARPGFRVKRRKVQKQKIDSKHEITAEEALAFAQSNFDVKLKEEEK